MTPRWQWYISHRQRRRWNTAIEGKQGKSKKPPEVLSRRFMQTLGEGTALSSLGCCVVGMMNVIIQTASGQRVNWQRGIREEGKTFLSCYLAPVPDSTEGASTTRIGSKQRSGLCHSSLYVMAGKTRHIHLWKVGNMDPCMTASNGHSNRARS